MSTDICNLLNRLIAIHARSLPSYLADAAPFLTAKDAHSQDILNMVAADHQLTVDKLAEAVIERDGFVYQGTFPVEFTAYHDLSLDYLLGKVLDRQRNEVVEIEKIVNQISGDSEALSLAEEALGAAKGHLQSIEELTNMLPVN